MIDNMKAVAYTRKIGGSLVVTIPKEIVREEGLQENQTVEIEIEKVKKSGFGLLKGMHSFRKEDEFSSHA